MTSSSSVGYLAVLRGNRNFRRLWYGQIVSQLGDWLVSIALFTLLLNLTGSGQAVGLLLVAEFLPGALVGPFAGVMIDRLPRKLVMIGADIVRALIVLLLLLVDGPEMVWLVYLAVAARVSLTAFFEPARSAIIPSLCRREELVSANAISGVTWSAMLALGAAIGGLVAGTLGVQVAFMVNAATYLFSAVLIATIRVDEAGGRRQAAGGRLGDRGAEARVLPELAEGLRYVFAHRELAWLTFSKTLWSMGGGVLLLLTLFGRDLFPLGRDGAISIGLLYAARGLGTGVGPFLALRIGGDGPQFLRRMIGPAFFITAAGYLVFSGAPTLAVAMLAVFAAHMGGSIQWVFSTSLLQMRVPNRLRGRIFALEYAGLTLATALSGYITGVISDMGLGPRSLAIVMVGVFVLTGIVLTFALWRERRDPQAVSETAR
jgi:MFS family permease